jgi:HEAT repeat protein
MIRGTALGILAKTDPEGTRPLLLKYAEAKNDEGLRASAFRAMGALDAADAASRAVLLAVFSESATRSRAVTGAALAALEQRKDRDAIPALQNLADAATGNGKRAYLDAIRAIESDRDADASVGSADQ